jgi:hypothetical protein
MMSMLRKDISDDPQTSTREGIWSLLRDFGNTVRGKA